MNIAEHVEAAARRFPEQAAILFEDEVLGYRALEARASRCARLLHGFGVAAGDRVAVFLPNVPDFAVVYLAAQKIGAVVVSVNAAARTDEARFVLADSGAVALFTTGTLFREVAGVRALLPQLRHVVVCDESPVDGLPSLAAATAGLGEDFAARTLAPSAPAAILYTSGTTGRPKGAVLTHGNVVSNSQATVRCVGAQPGDRHILYLPLFHCFGQNFIMNAAFGSAGTLVLERRFGVETTLEAVRRHRVTHFYGVPTVFIRLLAAGIDGERLTSVRYFFSAAAPMPREVASVWQQRFRRPIHEGYGLTETSPFASYNHATRYKLGSIGAPIDGVAMKVIDEQGRECADGAWGEICIKGPNVMAGYFGRVEETEAVLRDGWFLSGDIGFRDAEGYYFLVDRKKDMINCAGWKVWPREVEDVLHQHPAVEECAVVGVPDAERGEAVRAFVRVRAGTAASADELRGHCQARLSAYKVPGQILLTDDIPRNPAGKVLKRVLRGRPGRER